jgi:hypothetical protein
MARFAFLPLAKIKVATSVCTGGRNCPPDGSTAMGSRPAPWKKEKKKSRPDWDDFSFLAKVHEVDTILQETAMQQPTLADFLLTSRTLHHYGIPRIAASVL